MLEQISETGGAVASDVAFQSGTTLTLDSGTLIAPAEVVTSRRRESDYLTEFRFIDGFRWSPTRWKPDHLCSVAGRKSGARSAPARTRAAAAGSDDEPFD